MRRIAPERDRLIEKDFFDFPIRDSMLRPVLTDVSIVPVATFPRGRVEIDHRQCISEVYTDRQGFHPQMTLMCADESVFHLRSSA